MYLFIAAAIQILSNQRGKVSTSITELLKLLFKKKLAR